MQITEEHLKVIQMLRRDPRKRFLEISRRTQIPLDRVFDIYYELKQNDILKTYTLIDLPEKTRIINVIIIFIPVGDQFKTLNFLKKIDNVNTISLTEREFIVHASFLGLKEYDIFVDWLETMDVQDIKEYFISEIIT